MIKTRVVRISIFRLVSWYSYFEFFFLDISGSYGYGIIFGISVLAWYEYQNLYEEDAGINNSEFAIEYQSNMWY
jgi:hypothetical protein